MKKSRIILITVSILVIILGSIIVWKLNYNQNSSQFPTWLNDKIQKEINLNQVSECNYNSQKVYSFNHGCCDFIDNLYNEKGEVICSVGGIAVINTCKNITTTNCKIIWENSK